MPSPKNGPPKVDVDELAKYIYDIQAHMAGLYVVTWERAHPKGLARSRHLARRLLTDMPAVLRRYLEASNV